jgi:hypothetical protein
VGWSYVEQGLGITTTMQLLLFVSQMQQQQQLCWVIDKPLEFLLFRMMEDCVSSPHKDDVVPVRQSAPF